MVKKRTSKLFHGLMALLLVVSVFLPALKVSNVVKAEELPASSYTMKTVSKINNNKLVDGAKYGEGKFYLQPTYSFPNEVTLKDGDYMVYHVPNEFKIEKDSVTELKAPDGQTTIAELTTSRADNTATVKVTNAAYFANLSENKEITALFTVVWADSVKLNTPYQINIPGDQVYTLTRIVPDDDPTGFTKWGVQDSDDPNYVNWRIRVNRYAKSYTGVKLEDTIPEGQVLASEITGYYFTEWNKAEARPRLEAAHVNVVDGNHFTITPNGDGTMDGQGLYILYKTRLTAPVDNATKKAFNDVKATTDQETFDVHGFAPLTTTEGIGSGAKSDEVEFQVKKKLEGKTLEADAFTFQLIAPDGSVTEAKNDAEGKVKFPAVKFSNEGTFKYQIKEVNDNKPGYTYDDSVLEAEVTVANVYGQKIASVKYKDSKKEFTNSYAAKEAKLQLEAKKVLNGKAIEAGQFEFELKENGAVLHTVSNDANGKIQFPELTFTKEETRTFTISEKAGDVAGVEYDPNAYEVKVVVKDNGQGQLVATPDTKNITFTNVYKAKPDKKTITATKVLNGKELEADKYEFELKKDEEVVATAKNAADGTVTFKEIEFATAGDYTYTITEKAGSEKGVTYDTAKHEVKVKVTDNGQGQLVAAVTGNNPTFTNTYKAATTTATITATKVLNGKALEAGKYEFELKEGDKVIGTATNAADGTVTFEDIKYAAAGNHTYTITEKAGSEAGVTYDTAKHEVKVAVTDNGAGQLVATVTDNNPTFTNTYKAAKTTATITAKKVLDGKALEADKYEFELKEGDEVIGTAKNAADGTVTFPAISYDAAGPHTYTITEKAGSEAGVTYDTATHEVTVNVTDNGQGQLVATATNNNPTFTNTYKAATTTATITATKVLNGKALEADKYEFELKEGEKVVATAKNAADGTVTFEDITYTVAGNHTYTITEKAGSEAGVTYDTAKHEVKVAVVDNGAGELVATVTDNNPTFTNTYKAASTTVNITAKKVLNGKTLEAGKYEFELKEGDKVIGTATNAVDGTVAFAGIEYKEAGEHTYTISEKAGNEAGVTYDKSTHNVTVKVVDNGAGKLVATVTDNNPTFTNTYVASSTQVIFSAKKVLKGDKKLVEGQFKFELKEGDKVVETATNAADGTVTFKAIKYNEAGKHTYTITEVDSKEENVTYDTAKHEVTVEVVDNGTGQLVTTVTGNNPTFTNTYTEPKKEEPKEGPKGEQPKKDLPNTGGADFTAFSTILGLVLAALAGLVYRAKKVD
ncbi:LPXTG cell wall anchor domain-containing protein [Streptococcus oralis]|nr:LPXTG cell wall anchor domain-containing protein [Streptococcus oralis]MBZ2095011.1 LPXTG cell wall anchor domain-containing protein [Streptococcus oralis]MBZ2098423.1 LPXTG cell wall anchor domain-containing protein [Streptococcus oralis]QXW61402.1 LPXTG cell wall anchor domain-containing protein [Streptococcus oralis]